MRYILLIIIITILNINYTNGVQSIHRGNSRLGCKHSFQIEKNLTVCLDYVYNEKRQIYVVSSSKHLSPEWDERLIKAKRVRAIIFDKKKSDSNKDIIMTDVPLTGTEGKRPILHKPYIANINSYSLATAFQQLETDILDIVYLSESKYLENIIKTAIATDAIRHIKYLILKIPKLKLSLYNQFLVDHEMMTIASKAFSTPYNIYIFVQKELHLHKPVIQMDYARRIRHDENSQVEFFNYEAEQLMYEVYLHKYLDNELLMERFYKWILSPTINCPVFKRFGKPYDGGWDVCLHYNLISEENCKVYSFGINNDFSFDDAISKEKGCKVRSFDPSMRNVKEKRSELVSFYEIGLSGSDFVNEQQWTMRSWRSVLRTFNDEDKVIDYLKFDIESSEWLLFETALVDGSFSKVKQISFELHGIGSPYRPIVERWKLLKRLESEGFLRWKTHINEWTMKPNQYTSTRVNCIEVYYINLKFII
ncbi:DgyrCDS3070 [Dimorphilus gyrociliatus]|uniref:DgyrCDS3070 n=1 Tax=Dimorphilus gyrociliatus TaxID=2664684 RepID=A0A7I8VF48_9ANNE|nr:DgyrCDS3070 [Dimorphilus gyrociliatus]